MAGRAIRATKVTSGGGVGNTLGGLGALLAGLLVLALSQGDDSHLPSVAALVGVVFSVIGISLMFGRRVVSIDPEGRCANVSKGLLGLGTRQSHPLNSFETVSLSKESRSSGDTNYVVYPVRLEGPVRPQGGGLTLLVCEPRSLLLAHSEAERMAKSLDLPLSDRSLGREIIRPACELDETLRARVKKSGSMPTPPPREPGFRFECEMAGGAATFKLPRRGWTLASGFAVMLGLFVTVTFGGVGLVFCLQGAGGEVGALVIGLLLLLMGVLIPMFGIVRPALVRDFTQRTIAASPEKLEVRIKGLLRSTTLAIPVAELEDLIVVAGPALQEMPPAASSFVRSFAGELFDSYIFARSDHQIVTFGHGLSEAELAWLEGTILRAVLA